jgi:hypothetical protein
MLACLTEFSALPQLSPRAVVRRGGEACALAQRWCLTACLTSDRVEIRPLGLSITEPDPEFVHYGPDGHEMGHELGRNRASQAHPRRLVVPICAGSHTVQLAMTASASFRG